MTDESGGCNSDEKNWPRNITQQKKRCFSVGSRELTIAQINKIIGMEPAKKDVNTDKESVAIQTQK